VDNKLFYYKPYLINYLKIVLINKAIQFFKNNFHFSNLNFFFIHFILVVCKIKTLGISCVKDSTTYNESKNTIHLQHLYVLIIIIIKTYSKEP